MRSEHEPQRTPLDKAAIEEWREYEAANDAARVDYWQRVHGVPPTPEQRARRAALSRAYRARKRAEKESSK